MICVGMESIWVSGNDHRVYCMDNAGSILDVCDVKFENNVNVEVAALCIDQQSKLIFSLSWPHKKVYKYNKGKIEVMIDLSPWIPSGLSRSQNGDLLVIMRSSDDDNYQSRVVRLAENTEKQTNYSI